MDLNHMASAASMSALPPAPSAELLNLLIVDDERAVREGCQEAAESLGFQCFTAENTDSTYKILDSRGIDVVLLDVHLPNSGGVELLREIKRRRPQAAIIVTTGSATVHSAVRAMQYGAYDYVTKPFDLDEMKLLLGRVAGHVKIAVENRVLRQKIKSKEGFGNIIGRSPEMEKLYRLICKAAGASHSVLILGESGTGKELVARAVHFSGPYRHHPFIPVDCGSLVPTLIESELFGYVKGAFTGAHKAKEGLLSLGEGGTIFLDEIGELSPELQSKLLRALQEKEIRPVGGTKSLPIHVRILAATNCNLEAAIAEGRFRKELYFRLNVLTLRIPPLRERKQDIPLLIGHFISRISRLNSHQLTLSDEALKLMLSYDWPGNVRELENCLERAAAVSSGPVLHVGDLPTGVQNAMQQRPLAAAGNSSHVTPMAALEKQAILNAMVQLHGDKIETARQLGIGKTTLYRKLKEYKLSEFGVL
jgi:two-component system response regulator HydG